MRRYSPRLPAASISCCPQPAAPRPSQSSSISCVPGRLRGGGGNPDLLMTLRVFVSAAIPGSETPLALYGVVSGRQVLGDRLAREGTMEAQ
jgi:hypothetical protein